MVIYVYLASKTKRGLIPPSTASAVQECLTLTMTKVLECYHKSFGKSLSTSEVSKAFEIEVGEWCTSQIIEHINDYPHDVGNAGPGLGSKHSRIKLVNRIPTISSFIHVCTI